MRVFSVREVGNVADVMYRGESPVVRYQVVARAGSRYEVRFGTFATRAEADADVERRERPRELTA
jgi:hypothetical protein